jgi:competence protein ComEA
MKIITRTALLSLLLLSLNAFASVNINTADAPAIAKELKGIGDKKAQAIVLYRKQHGPFKTIESLTEVKGIGLKTVEKNRSLIKLSSK